MDPDLLDGKVALVTGAANGIGAAVARRLASHGARVVAVDVDDEAGRTVATETGGTFVHADVRSLEANRAMVAAAVDTYGGIDLVHLNAGVSSGHGLGDDFSEETYRRAMGINLDGVVFGIHAAIPALRARGGGAIVATASLAALTPVAFDPIYAANKAAVVHLVRSMALALAGDAITVNALCPSFAETAIITEIRPFLVDQAFPILEVAEVVDTFMDVLAGGGTGEAWFVVPGRTAVPFEFRNVPGPRTPGAR